MQVKTIRKTHQHHSKMYIFLEKCTTTHQNQGDDILVFQGSVEFAQKRKLRHSKAKRVDQ